MDDGRPGQRGPVTLPMHIEALEANADPSPWMGFAETARFIGLGLIMRGLQRGHLTMMAATEGSVWLPFACGALGAGAVLIGCDANAPMDEIVELVGRHRCKIVLLDDDERLERLVTHGSQMPDLLALVGPTNVVHWSARPSVHAVPDLMALGRAVHQLDPGMWGGCLAEIRPMHPALRTASSASAAETYSGEMSHRDCERALSPLLAEPPLLAAGLASLIMDRLDA